MPGTAGIWAAFAGETGTTFVLVVSLLTFVGHHRLRRFTPLILPPLHTVMVWLCRTRPRSEERDAPGRSG